MKKILGGLIPASLVLAGGSLFTTPLFAGPHFRVGIGLGYPIAPAPVYVAPAPEYVAPDAPVVAVPPIPGPGYNWVDGYWYFNGGHRLWHAGYWAPPVHVDHFAHGYRR